MRIIVNGQQAFGKAVLEALLDRGEEVVGVYCGPDRPGRPSDPLKACAEERGLPVFQPPSFRKPEVREQMRSLSPDLCVMAYVTLIVPEEALNVPRLGTIQYHPSLLPRHRGPSSINWPIIFGETRTGLTIFWPDEGLDTGPILLQKEVEIGPDDTLGTLYFGKLFPMGVEAMLESVDLVREGKAPRIPQDESKATYEGWCRLEDVGIDFSRPVREVYNLVRGSNPQPGAWGLWQGRRLQIFDAARRDEPRGEPGEVLAIDEEGMLIATGEGALLARRVRPEGGEKIPAHEFAAQGGVSVGERIESGASRQ